MMKKLLTITLAGALLFGAPAVGFAGTAVEIIEQDFQQATVTISGNTLHVVGANDQVLHIYNVAGVRVMSFKVEGADRHYELNLPKGCYIVKVGKTVKKISVR
ncbi:MAG: T9SS type A sorting domain-containing protein [Prevotella sp.]|nr:T9SS type A sorting domain-containing protein [Prevotella sp.]MBQ9651398.1 T9SS type A sorting domain-containing protein [Prevotella sp.]